MHRRGSIYLVVLSTVTVVALLGTAGVLAQTRQRARAETAHDTARAAALARAAVELGMQHISEEDDWRDARGKGEWHTDLAPTGNPRDGTFTLTVTGPGGSSLKIGADEPFEMIGIGTYGDARRQIIVPFDAVATVEPLDCLEVGALAANSIELQFNAAVLGVETLASKNDVKANIALVQVPVEAESKALGSIYYAGKTSGVSRRTLPGAKSVAGEYASDQASIPSDRVRSGGDIHLTNAVLAPGYNPFDTGNVNARGVYYIDCDGDDVIIENFRMHGTLILDRIGNDSVIRGSNSFAPAVEGYPSLIVVNDDIRFETSSAALSESGTGVNYNPVGAADESGVEDADTADTYPSAFEGIVHIGGAVAIPSGGNLRINGHLFADNTLDMAAGSFLTLNTWSEARTSPPLGYRDAGAATLVMQPWRRDLD